jgi:hypothetical protein
MSEFTPTPEFEEKLRLALATPEPEPGFAQSLRSRLSERAAAPAARRSFRLRPAWGILLGLVLLLVMAVLIIGPQRVAAEVQKLLGYIPGFGIVEQNAALRVLAEPVTQRRDGITVTVKQAFLTSDKTTVTYSVEGVPWSALSHNENISGCTETPGLRLPDGTLLEIIGGGGPPMEIKMDYPAIPADIDKTTFVLPCIQETLPGLAPENWELPLRFVPAPGDLTVMPVIDVSPSPEPQLNTPVPPKNPLALLKVVDTGDNYVLLGEFRRTDANDPSLPSGSWWSVGLQTITDATGQDVFNTVPNDPSLQLPPSQPEAEPWAYQIGKTFTPPLTITYTGQSTFPADPNAKAELEFDAGANPQVGQAWMLNQDFELAGHKIRLVSIQAVPQSGFEFSFETSDPAVSSVSVEISGYIPDGGGGGGSPRLTQGKWSEDLNYAEQPTGKLKVVVSDLMLYGENKTWQIQWSPGTAQPGSPSLYGISLAVDRFIPLSDGYYLIGHTDWADGRITGVSPAEWALKAYDSKGQEVPLEPASPDDAGLTLEPDQWLYKIYGKSFNAPLSLRAAQMDVVFKQPVRLTLDLRSYGFDGSEAQLGTMWKIGGNPLDVPGLLATAYWVTYTKSGDLLGFEIGIDADPALQELPFSIESGLDTQGMSRVAGAGGSNRDEATGRLLSSVLTDAKITFPLVLRADGATLNGKWETTWNPPSSDPNATPSSVIQPCLTLAAWKQAVGNPPPLPAGLPEKALVSRGALSPDPSLFIASLDGSTAQGLVFGQGSLSPDSTRLAYSGGGNAQENHLNVMDISTKDNTLLTQDTFDLRPLWSPDGTQIAFSRLTSQGYNVFVMAADGKNVRALTDTTDGILAAGWTPDGRKVLAVTVQGSVQLLDVAGGAAQSLSFIRQSGDMDISISPDGQWIAFVDKVPGRMNPGIYISRLNGTEKRLLVQLDTWTAGLPLWSPDGNWLAFLVGDTDAQNPNGIPALVNVKTCQVVPLPGLNGELRGWVK